jgi:two-component system chemotaxis response regulator CheB
MSKPTPSPQVIRWFLPDQPSARSAEESWIAKGILISIGRKSLDDRNAPRPLAAVGIPLAMWGSSDSNTRMTRIIEQLLQSLKKVDSKNDSPIYAKIIGTQFLIELASRSLKEKGIPIEKLVERYEPFEVLIDSLKGKIRLARTLSHPHRLGEPSTSHDVQTPSENLDSRKTRVLIVDDSITVRKLLCSVISESPEFEVIGLAESAQELSELIQRGPRPDVVTLDLNLPDKNGLDILKEILVPAKISAVVVSTLTMEDGPTVLSALEAGAVDYVQKPSLAEIPALRESLHERLKSAASAHLQVASGASELLEKDRFTSKERVRKKFGMQPKALPFPASHGFAQSLILMGASTGGTEAIRRVLLGLPEEIPPILIVQHIPGGFSKAFAERLNASMPFAVREAKHDELIEPGVVLIAPGGYQFSIQEKAGRLYTQIQDTAAVNRHKPSVDVLFESASKLKHWSRLGIILTGMGNDGAQGLLKLRESGAQTLAQDEASCVVFGMPREAIRLGAVERTLPLSSLSGAIAQWNDAIQTKKTAA